MTKMIALIALAISMNAFANSEAYQDLNSDQKQELVWQKISAKPYDTLPEMTFFAPEDWKAMHAARAAKAAGSLGKSFDHVSDEMPEGRVKIIHAYGSSVQIEFITLKNHPFTGLFKSGALGIARLSLGTPLATTGSFVPGMAIKLFIDSQPSKNMHVMQRLEGQGENSDFFKFTFTNKLPEPTDKGTKLGAKYFARFVENPIFLKVDHVAQYRSNGDKEQTVVAPYQIFFQPADVHLPENSKDFRAELAKIPVGSKLYDVFAQYSQHTKTPIHIGSIVTRSSFVASEYQDKKLYFQHEGAVRRTFWTGRKLN